MSLLYIIWSLFPAFFFLTALWGLLEKVSGSRKKHSPGDFSKQGVFLSVCVIISIAIDKYLLSAFEPALPEWLPLLFLQIILFPLVLLIGAQIFGGSKPIRIKRPG